MDLTVVKKALEDAVKKLQACERRINKGLLHCMPRLDNTIDQGEKALQEFEFTCQCPRCGHTLTDKTSQLPQASLHTHDVKQAQKS